MRRRWAAALALLVATGLPACAAMPVRTGTSPRIDLVEAALVVGQTRRSQVLEVMGTPDGAGRAFLPMHTEPRVVWNYIEQDAGWEVFSWRHLLLFFDGQVLTGYLWYTIEDLPIDNAAPEWLRQGLE